MEEGLLRVAVLLAACGLVGIAWAGGVDDQVQAARQALAQGEVRDAQETLKSAEEAAPGSPEVVATPTLARLWYYRAVAEHRLGDKKGRAMDLWRQALVTDLDLPWDMDLVADTELRDLYLALRTEVSGRDRVDVGVPEATGAARLFVDGRRVRAGDEVVQGLHLAQISCDDGSVHGEWTDFAKPPRWFKLCPGGVDTTVVLAESEPVEDEWAEFGPAFGVPSSGAELLGGSEVGETAAAPQPAPPPEPRAPARAPVVVRATVVPAGETPREQPPASPPQPAPRPVATAPTPAPAASAPPAASPPPVATASPPPEPAGPARHRGRAGGVLLMVGGGAFAAGAAAVNFGVVNPVYAEIEAARASPRDTSRAEADDLTRRFDTARAVTIGLGAGGALLFGGGVAVTALHVQAGGGGWQLGLAGRF